MADEELNEEKNEENDWIDPFDLLTEEEAAGFSFETHRVGEQNILTPALKAKGYRFTTHWYTEEADSFGPLIRGAGALDKDGKPVKFLYG